MARDGHPATEATDERPAYLPGPGLWPHLQIYQDAFDDLLSERRDGGPIPWTAIDAYARRYGITEPEHFERLVVCVQALDREHLAYLRSKLETKQADGDTGND